MTQFLSVHEMGLMYFPTTKDYDWDSIGCFCLFACLFWVVCSFSLEGVRLSNTLIKQSNVWILT